MVLPQLKIRNTIVETPIIQGGMGIGLSNYTLAGSVAKEGGLGVLSSAGLDRIVAKRHGKKIFNPRKAAALDVRDAKEVAGGKPIGMNIMVALVNQYEASVLGSMDGGVDVIISGAGLPMSLPAIAESHVRAKEVALVPIVASGRALDLICRRWKRSNRLPDAVIVEGPKAGGHIAWRTLEEAKAPEHQLEVITDEVIEAAKKWGDIPVIAAGGIYTHQDIVDYINRGCAGVQMGTRFLATHESGASKTYKQRLVDLEEEDIQLAVKNGSPCGMLFRVIKDCPFYEEAVAELRAPNCSKGYVLTKDKFCTSKVGTDTLCICNGLMASIDMAPGEKELYTIGSNGYRIEEIVSVHELMNELKGEEASQVNRPKRAAASSL